MDDLIARLEGGDAGADLDRMVRAMIVQSGTYPVVPPNLAGRVEPLSYFTARLCLLAALRALAPKED